MTPGASDLWFLPLGGCGEIGMNFNLYGHDGRWLIVDCGVTFGRDGEPGPEIQMPDPAFIEARRDDISAMVITHAHEDHVGAVPHLWPRLRCPVYTTAFTAEILRRKLREHDLIDQVPIHVVQRDDRLALDGFELEWVGLTHSVPDANALMLRTAAGSVFHTADWKLDPAPVVGPAYDEQRYRALAAEGVGTMVCDSTNATVEGHSRSEADLYDGLKRCVARAEGHVFVTCFGSNIARLHTLARIARATGRYLGLLGRSLHNMVSAARAAGVWDPAYRIVDPFDLGYLPGREVLVATTGSQGERYAALDRLANDTHPQPSLDPGDTVVYTNRLIPGNERPVKDLYLRLQGRGARVLTDVDVDLPIHASGHPAREELRKMYRWV